LAPPDRESAINPADYSALANFLRGYLHQDVAVIHGSPIRAAHAFRNDADEGETAIVQAELERLLDETSGLPDADLSQIIEQLGSSWQFRSRRELEELRDAFK
jgi:hypothetical protein